MFKPLNTLKTPEEILIVCEPIILCVARKLGVKETDLCYDEVLQTGRITALECYANWSKKKHTKLKSFIWSCCRNRMISALYGCGVNNICYNNRVTPHKFKNGSDEKYKFITILDSDLMDKIYHSDETPVDDLYTLDRVELIQTVNKYLVSNYGKKVTELILKAFTYSSQRDGTVGKDYDYIADRYDLLKKHFVVYRNRKCKKDFRRLWNIRKSILRMLITAFTNDNIGVDRLIPYPK